MILFGALAVLLVAALAVIIVRTPRRASAVPTEVAAVTALAILLSPIAWDHYWTLLFPAFLILYDSQDRRLLGRAGRYAFWTAAVLTTGLSPLTLGRSGFNLARDLSVYTIAALIVYVGLIVVCRKSEPRAARAASREQLMADEHHQPGTDGADEIDDRQEGERPMQAARVEQHAARARDGLGAEECRGGTDEGHPRGDEHVALRVEPVGVDSRVGEEAIEALSRQKEQQHHPGHNHRLLLHCKERIFSTHCFTTRYRLRVAS